MCVKIEAQSEGGLCIFPVSQITLLLNVFMCVCMYTLVLRALIVPFLFVCLYAI